MAARLVFDYPGRQTRRYIGRAIARLMGAVLIVIGLLATVIALPAGLVTLADIVNRLQPQPEQLFEPGFPLREAEAGFAAALVVAIAGVRYGRRLVRGHRTIVLFLRRFGYDGSMQAVTFAVAHTIGVAWRLVTLDDAEIAPLGVAPSSRFLFRAGERTVTVIMAAGRAVFVLFPWAIWGILIVIAIQVATAWPDWRQLLTDGTLDRYTAIFASVMEGRIPTQYFALTLTGAFAVLATVGLAAFIGLMATMAVLLAMLPLFGFVVMATSSAEAVRKAEKAKVRTITLRDDVPRVVHDVSVQSRETFAPQLVVLRVATLAWRATVSALAAVASATIIDISEPTDNLTWEVLELQRLDPARCIFIGDYPRIAGWVEADPASLPADSLERRLAHLIAGRDVLAYETTRRGMRRFAHALYGKLIDMPVEAGVRVA